MINGGRLQMNNSNHTDIRILTGVLLLFFLLLTINVGAAVITVGPSGCNYTTIQGAINNASTGDTILVQSGTYHEVIDINRSVSLIGSDSSGAYPHVGKYQMPVAVTISAPDVTFDGFDPYGAGEHAIEITASHVSIRNVTFSIHRPGNAEDAIITGSGLSDVTITNSSMQCTEGYGIYFVDSQGITIKNNLIMVNSESNVTAKAISVTLTTDNATFSGFVIENNTIYDGGIVLSSASSGIITFPVVRDIIIHKNTITEPGGRGIYVGGFMDLSGEFHFFNATITQNTVTGARTSLTNLEINAISGGVIKDNRIEDSIHGADGMSLENLDGFTIQGNTVKDCTVNPLWGTVGFNLETTTNSIVSGNMVTHVTPYSFRYAPGPNFLPNLTVDSTNTADGKPVLYYEGKNGVTIDGQDPAMVVMLSCSDMKITNSNIENTGLGVGIYNCTGTTVSGTGFLDTNTGMMLIQSADSVIERNTFKGSFMGLGVGDNTNARIYANNFSEYSDSGIVVHTGTSDNVTITENTLLGSMSGLEQAIVTSDTNGAGVTIAHNTMEHNTRGILIYFTTNMAYLDNTIKNGGLGINLNAAQDNVIRNNTIQNEDADSMGVYMFNNMTLGGGLVVNNEFSNNYILSETPLLVEYSAKSPDDARVFGPIWGPEIQGVNASEIREDPGTYNIWNVTKTAGTNIVSGPFLGGNYWAMPNGSGWSQITPDRGDGFCNAPFVYDTNNTDYLPLNLNGGEIPITAPAVIDSPGSYRLTNDFSNSSVETAIWIKASDVVLNGNGHTLTGGVLVNSSGVLSAKDGEVLDNVTIRNLVTNKWERGIFMRDNSNITVFNCTSTENYVGLSIEGVHGGSIEECNLSQNTLNSYGYEAWGLDIRYSDGIEVKANDIHSNKPFDAPFSSSGIICTDSSVVISNNHIWDHDGAGILLTGANSTRVTVIVRDNLIDNFGGKGIDLYANGENQSIILLNNTINAPEGTIGILAFRTQSVNITANTITCKERGIVLVESMNDTLSRNTVLGANHGFGIIGSQDELAYYYHNIDDTNTAAGKPVRYFKDITGPFIDDSVDAATIIAVNCSNGIIKDQTLSKNHNGVLLAGCRNMTVKNSVFNNNFNGIETVRTENCVIRDVTTSDNTFIGLSLNYDSDLLLVNSTSENNGGFGILLNYNNGFVLQDSVVNSNGFSIVSGAGISASQSQGTLINITTQMNTRWGILAMGSSTLSIDDSHIFDTNGNGLQMENAECSISNSEIARSENAGVTVYNEGAHIQMHGCIITDSKYAGIWFSDATASTPSVLTNNIFNNTQNVLIDAENDPITWNVTKTAGTNIVNGPFLGGNYWATPNGTGWSQITPDRGDGFCNAPFDIDGSNTDSLPLHLITQSSNVGVFRGGVFYRNGATDIVYGLPADTPVIGDWNGDGMSEVGVWRGGVFYRNGATDIVYGLPTDTPVIGDWNGDGMSEVGVWRGGVFYRNGATDIVYGLPTDTPVIGKWT